MNFSENYFNEVIAISKKVDTQKIENLASQINDLRVNKGRLFFIGVGGSAANASHAVNDFRKLCNIECYTPTDNVSELSARTNDEGWETVFSAWLEVSKISANDALFILSVGGGNKEKNVSVSIINAIELAKKVGSKVFGIVGKSNGYTFKHSDLCIQVPEVNEDRITPHSEEFQTVIWHCLVSNPILQQNQTKW